MRFIADVMLGRLARMMRFRGYDVEYDNHISDEELLRKSRHRIVLTKDRQLTSRIKPARVYLVQGSNSERQLEEIAQQFPQKLPAVRCLVCNSKIKRVAKRKVEHLIPPFIFRRYSEFYFCRACRRIYWPGTHYERMSRMIK
jgi:uncharacterized protein